MVTFISYRPCAPVVESLRICENVSNRLVRLPGSHHIPCGHRASMTRAKCTESCILTPAGAENCNTRFRDSQYVTLFVCFDPVDNSLLRYQCPGVRLDYISAMNRSQMHTPSLNASERLLATYATPLHSCLRQVAVSL